MQPTINDLRQFLAGPPPETMKNRQVRLESATLTATNDGYTRRLSITTAGGYAGHITIADYRKALGVPADAKETRKTENTAKRWYIVSLSWRVDPPPVQADFFGGNL